jgi:hypothetical protein
VLSSRKFREDMAHPIDEGAPPDQAGGDDVCDWGTGRFVPGISG